MGSYANQKDLFNSDSGLWTILTTHGASAIVSGARTFSKSSTNAFNETGMVFATAKTATNGDAICISFSLDDLDTTETYLRIYLRQSGSLSNAAPIGAYIYPDGGVIKAHGETSGICNDLTASQTMVQGEVYTLRFLVNGSNGKLTIGIKGGVFGASYVDLATESASLVAYGNVQMQVNLYSTKSDCSIYDYQWFDSTGADVESIPGSIKDSSTFASSSGWSKTELGGTVTFTGNEMVVARSVTDGWITGAWRTTPTTIAKGDIILFNTRFTTSNANEAVIWLRDDGSITLVTGTEGRGYYYHQSASVDYLQTINLTLDSYLTAISQNTIYNHKLVCDASTGVLTAWIKSFNDSVFSQIGHSAGDVSGVAKYLGCTVYDHGQDIYISNFLWTDGVVNAAPSVDAGEDQVLAWPDSTTVQMGATTSDPDDDDLTLLWTVTDKPIGSTATFDDDSIEDPLITVDAYGAYVFRLTADDGITTPTYDDVQVWFIPDAVVNAGPNQRLYAPDLEAAILGTIDDHPIEGGSPTKTWTKVSGPGSVSFGNIHNLSTTATFGTTGRYVLRLTYDSNDGGPNDVQSDDVVICVLPQTLAETLTLNTTNHQQIKQGRF